MKSRSPGASHEIWWLSGRGMKSGSTPLPVCRNSVLFDNSLNDKRFRIDIRVENGYEEGCTRGAKNASAGFSGSCLTLGPVGITPRGLVVSSVLTPTYGRPHIYPDSPFRSPQSGNRVQPWGLRTLTENVLSEFSRSPFFDPPCLTARLHPDICFDISNSPPVGIRRKPDQWVRRKRITRQRKQP